MQQPAIQSDQGQMWVSSRCIDDQKVADKGGDSRRVAAGVVKLDRQIGGCRGQIDANVKADADLPPQIQVGGRRQSPTQRRLFPHDHRRGIIDPGPTATVVGLRSRLWRSTEDGAPARRERLVERPPDPNTPENRRRMKQLQG